MKTILTVIFLFGISSILAQKTKVLVWDASNPHKNSVHWEVDACSENLCHLGCGEMDEKLRIKTNELLAVKIINVNPYKYIYSVDGVPIDFFSDSRNNFEGLLGSLQEKTISNTGIDTINKQQEAPKEEKDSVRIKNSFPQAKDAIDSVNKYIKSLKVELDSIPEIPLIQGQKELLNKDGISSDFSGLENAIENLTNVIESQQELIKQQMEFLDELKEENSSLRRRLDDLINSTKLLEEERDSLKNELNMKLTFDKFRYKILFKAKELSAFKTNLELYLIDLKNEDFLNICETDGDCSEGSSDFVCKRKAFKEAYVQIIMDMEDLINDMDDKLKKEDLEKAKTLVKEKFLPNQQEVAKEIDILLAMKLFHFESPIEFDGENIDALHIKISRKPRFGNDAIETFDYTIWVTGGFKLDVSAGVFFSGLANHRFVFAPQQIVQNEATTQDNSNIPDDMNMDNNGEAVEETASETQQGKAINKSNSGGWEYGFGTLLNVSYRTGGWIKPAFSFGAMLTDDSKFQFLTGFSGILGKKQRAIIHVGAALGRVNRLQTGFKDDGVTLYNIADGAIPLEEKFDVGLFFGLTYNLSKPKIND